MTTNPSNSGDVNFMFRSPEVPFAERDINVVLPHITYYPTIFVPTVLGVKLLRPDATLPTKAHDTDMGFDLYAAEDTKIESGAATTLVSTGIACQFPKSYGGLIRDRSGMAVKTSIFVVAGVIDEEYTGEIKVAFKNLGAPYHIEKGQKIAQMILTWVPQIQVSVIEDVVETNRAAKGFGSSGV